MFSHSNNNLISGCSFTHIEHGGQAAFDKLHATIADGAMHNSGERFDPPKCYPGTRVAVIKKLYNWIINNRDTFIHWLYGPAGAGKSAIMQEIAELCFGKGTLIASFFFSRTATLRKDHTRLVSTIAYQLAQSIPETRAYIEGVVKDDPALFSKDLQTQLQSLVIEPLNRAFPPLPATKSTPHVILIDGLDECNNPVVQQHILTSLLTVSAKCNHRLVFLIASRPETHLKMMFNSDLFKQGLARTALDDEYQPAKDIRLFLKGVFTELKETHPLRAYLPKDWPGLNKLDVLVQKSSGQFIYAATVARYISPPDTLPDDRLDIALGLPVRDNMHEFPFAELDALYIHILSSLRIKRTGLQVLALIAFPTPSTWYQWTPKKVDGFLDLREGTTEEVLNKLASVVAVKKRSAEVQILHASLMDFLMDKGRSGGLHIDLPQEGAHFARMCLRQFTSGTDQRVFDHAVECFEGYCQHAVHTEKLQHDLATLKIHAIAQNRLRRHKHDHFTVDVKDTFAPIISLYLQCAKRINFRDPLRDIVLAQCYEAVEEFVGSQVHLYRLASPFLHVLLVLYSESMLPWPSPVCKTNPCFASSLLGDDFSSRSVDHSSMGLWRQMSPISTWPSQEPPKPFIPFIKKFLNPEDFAMAANHMTQYIVDCESVFMSEWMYNEQPNDLPKTGWIVYPRSLRFEWNARNEHYDHALRCLPLLLSKAAIDDGLRSLLGRPRKSPDELIRRLAMPSKEFEEIRLPHPSDLEKLVKLRKRAEEAINDYLKRNSRKRKREDV